MCLFLSHTLHAVYALHTLAFSFSHAVLPAVSHPSLPLDFSHTRTTSPGDEEEEEEEEEGGRGGSHFARTPTRLANRANKFIVFYYSRSFLINHWLPLTQLTSAIGATLHMSDTHMPIVLRVRWHRASSCSDRAQDGTKWMGTPVAASVSWRRGIELTHCPQAGASTKLLLNMLKLVPAPSR